MAALPCLGLAPGRRLIWAPDWNCSDGRIAFDATSGDYWILSPLAAALVRALAEQACTPDETWMAARVAQVQADTGEVPEELPEQVLETLMREHLLAAA
ncbi:hypothetical protein HNQ51_003040 [Inhella inkyongensis]|uniref:Coenzyme PQQ synthesis protein D (PqqD) n=1 Tax=Inhella inkyongensis TaxID=392593 RepID=A0A840S7R6_9BURK|nr:hypothetical protein [Inhella inkyongensis]MBB5205713.1 hypothetical protein [Inhella inkyongensis]